MVFVTASIQNVSTIQHFMRTYFGKVKLKLAVERQKLPKQLNKEAARISFPFTTQNVIVIHNVNTFNSTDAFIRYDVIYNSDDVIIKRSAIFRSV